jgi:hypothetical protein
MLAFQICSFAINRLADGLPQNSPNIGVRPKIVKERVRPGCGLGAPRFGEMSQPGHSGARDRRQNSQSMDSTAGQRERGEKFGAEKRK